MTMPAGMVTDSDVTLTGDDPTVVLVRFRLTFPVSPAGNVLAAMVPAARGVGTIVVVTVTFPGNAAGATVADSDAVSFPVPGGVGSIFAAV